VARVATSALEWVNFTRILTQGAKSFLLNRQTLSFLYPSSSEMQCDEHAAN